MQKIVRINVTFSVPVEMSSVAHRALHDAVDLICAQYERENPSRVLWAAGEGGTPPPGFFFDEPSGEWDMSVLNIEVAERERYESDRSFKLSASAELREYIAKEIARCEKALPRYEEYAKSDNPEMRFGGASFQRKYERELRILKLARAALGTEAQSLEGAARE